LGCVAGSPTFLELLQRAKRVVQDAIQHADVPFARVVEAARVPRSTAHTPVFQTMMTLQGAVLGTQMDGTALALTSLEVGAIEVRCEDTRITMAGLSVSRELMLPAQCTAELVIAELVRPQLRTFIHNYHFAGRSCTSADGPGAEHGGRRGTNWGHCLRG